MALVCISSDHSIYAGVLRIQTRSYNVTLTKHRSPPHFTLASLACEPSLRRLLRNHHDQLTSALAHTTTHNQAFEVITHVVKTISKASPAFMPTPQPLNVGALQQLTAIGWKHVIDASADLTHLQCELQDATGRTHSFSLELSDLQHIQWQHHLPIEATLPSSDVTIANTMSLFQQHVDQLQPFWGAMDDLQSAFVVLDPNPLLTNHRHSRISMTQSCSIYLDINPDDPLAKPLAQVFGPEVAAKQRQQCWDSFLNWDTKRSLATNLKACFSAEAFELPVAASSMDTGVDKAECAVCYSFLLESKSPTEVCNNAACGRVYHNACLLEWLTALPDSRRSFQTVFGECPFCQGAMSVEIGIEPS
eukprot:m.120615 g.120615  ORF g.120615 m.120615 type:complete len:362 (+) comp15616_c0_seq3:1680-2765(+)